MTRELLIEAYWTAMEAAHMVDVITSEAHISIANAHWVACSRAEAFNIAKARYLIEHRAPNGHDVDLFGDGEMKPHAACHLDPRGDNT